MAAKITADVAERVWRNDYRGAFRDEGEVTVNGTTFWWWADVDKIWFYDRVEASGDDTCARFDVDQTFVEA